MLANARLRPTRSMLLWLPLVLLSLSQTERGGVSGSEADENVLDLERPVRPGRLKELLEETVGFSSVMCLPKHAV